MSTTAEELKQWFERGKKDGKTHMIVVCDTFDWDDYPVYVSKGENAREISEEYNRKEMQKIMEVYDLSISMEDQFGSGRVFNY